jgi:hypothetical protein
VRLATDPRANDDDRVVSTRNELIADVLMGAACADPLQDEPVVVVRRALEDVMGAAYLLADLDAQLNAFDPDAYDMAETVEALELADDQQKRQLLELIAAVEHADDVLAVEEDAYLRAVGAALGLPLEAYEDLTFDVEHVSRTSLPAVDRTSLFEARNSLLGPPPLPENEQS